MGAVNSIKAACYSWNRTCLTADERPLPDPAARASPLLPASAPRGFPVDPSARGKPDSKGICSMETELLNALLLAIRALNASRAGF